MLHVTSDLQVVTSAQLRKVATVGTLRVLPMLTLVLGTLRV